MRILLSTHNFHKATEIAPLLPSGCELLTLAEVGLRGDVEETAPDLAGNALIKARWAWKAVRQRADAAANDLYVIADDTGLEVAQLGGAPGVHTARYAGEGCSFDDNINKLLLTLKGVGNRRARFRTVVALIEPNAKETLFEGLCDGYIAQERQGLLGFGYDPIFLPEGFGGRSFAQMSLDEKNAVSHRGRALRKLADCLNNIK